jgi:CheY-like chemotaxis protein
MPTPITNVRPCVLIVEQDAVTRELLEQRLHLAGFATISAETGERALLMLRASRQVIDWLVTNQALPGLVDGGILADEFHVYHPNRAVVFCADRVLSVRQRPPLAQVEPPSSDIVTTLVAFRAAEQPSGGDRAHAEALAA